MAIRARLGMKACRHDLVAAFLQGQLQDDELIFMRMAPGYEQSDNHATRPKVIVCTYAQRELKIW